MARPRKRTIEPLADSDTLRYLLQALNPENTCVMVSGEEVLSWPHKEALEALNLIESASPARNIDCYECEHQCLSRPVTIIHDCAWVICPHQDGIGRIKIPEKQLVQKQITLNKVVTWLKKVFDAKLLLDTRETGEGINLGVVLAGKYRLVLSLNYEGGNWVLCAGNNKIKLIDAIGFDGEQYQLLPSQCELLLWADKSTEPREARRARLLATMNFRKAHKADFPGSITEQLAQEEGVSVSMIQNELTAARNSAVIQKLAREYLQKLQQENTH